MNAIFGSVYTSFSSFWPTPTEPTPTGPAAGPLSENEELFSISFEEKPLSPPFSPPTLIPLMMLDLVNATYEIGSDLLRSSSLELEVFFHRLQKKGVEIIEALRQAAAKAQEAGVWSMLQKIGSCVLFTFNIAVGFSMIGSGRETLGTVMIASGIFSLANVAVSEMKLWNDFARRLSRNNSDYEEFFRFWIPVFAHCVPLALNAGAFLYDPSIFSEPATFVWKQSVDLYGTVTTGGKHFAEGSLQWIEANISLIRSEIFSDSFLRDSRFAWIEAFLEAISRIVEQAKAIIQMNSQPRI